MGIREGTRLVHMKDDSMEISYILLLSYNDLPTMLKQCFLSFGMFPEDRVVDVDHMLWLWMAEGLVPRGEERMEDVAECFLNELIRQSLIQVVSTFWGKVYECRIRDLLRNLAIEKALHSIHGQTQRYLSLDLSNLKLRSIMFFEPEFCKMGLINFHNYFQHTYVLHLEIRAGTKLLPDSIGSLYHLKLLRLRGIHDLPSSIGNLKNLRTLHVDNSCHLPPETADLINLRHLVACLENLSTLSLLCNSDESFPAHEFLSSCQKLHKLFLTGRIENPLSFPFPNSITMMSLCDLKLMEDPMPILGMLPKLRNLYLRTDCKGKEITCSDNSFFQLEFLHLESLPKSERWHLATSAMPLIKGLGIHDYPKLKEIPERMKDVKRMKSLTV
ncbi:hypothetical protein CQW23_08617 [Capsicum baccatum]|uniref:NB-ARC domain-containing protein n=1 Tax=Capsicum baccatum TaxID=33114 RepID=A0A2G2X9I5_CAPBA|nr:hypothetical protein CQW23_08617 [Capsicum baccatum]